jgi:alkylmercury lyase-like protein
MLESKFLSKEISTSYRATKHRLYKTMINDTLLWQVRAFVYQHFADTTHPPSADVTAQHFNISLEEAAEYYKALNARHAFFLDPDTLNIRMAWPFSAIPTDFKVHANGKTYYANCAWDMLGIPVILQSDATAEAVCTESNDAVQLEIKNGQVTNSELLIHFPVAFSHWYDDLVFT